MNVTAEGQLTEEIEFWLRLSTIFFEAFRIKKDPGPTWFLLNEILKEGEGDFTIGDAVTALKAAGVAREKPAYDATQYTKQLCELGFIEVRDTGVEKRVFSVDTVLRITPTLEKAVGKYVDRFLKEFFDRETVDLAISLPSRPTINAIYDAMRDNYVPLWDRCLNELARISVKKTKRRQAKVFGRLRGKSEVFVLLHRLWEAELSGDVGNGFTLIELKDMHSRTRGAPPAAIGKYVALMSDDQILDTKESPNLKISYKLHRDCLPAFEQYAPDFIGARKTIRKKLHDFIASNSNKENLIGAS